MTGDPTYLLNSIAERVIVAIEQNFYKLLHHAGFFTLSPEL
jgi:hypothetical protein